MTQRLWRAAAVLLWTLAPPTFLCPTREFIYPCTCMDTFVGTYVMCSGIESDQMLRLPFQYLRDYNVSRLLLTNLNFSVPPDLFWGLRVGTLKITDSRFRVEEGTLEGRRSRVQSLEFMRSNVDTGLSFFGNLDFLETLCVQNSSVKHFARDWLATLVNLTHLTVDSTVFQILDSDALSDLPRLGTLIWTNNDLRYIGREFLPRRSRLLKTLDLSDNKLSWLPDNLFTNMPHLQTVVLSRNAFKVLSPKPWTNWLGQLSKLNLEGNPIVCNHTISWLLRAELKGKVVGRCAEPMELVGMSLADLDDLRWTR